MRIIKNLIRKYLGLDKQEAVAAQGLLEDSSRQAAEQEYQSPLDLDPISRLDTTVFELMRLQGLEPTEKLTRFQARSKIEDPDRVGQSDTIYDNQGWIFIGPKYEFEHENQKTTLSTGLGTHIDEFYKNETPNEYTSGLVYRTEGANGKGCTVYLESGCDNNLLFHVKIDDDEDFDPIIEELYDPMKLDKEGIEYEINDSQEVKGVIKDRASAERLIGIVVAETSREMLIAQTAEQQTTLYDL